MENLNEMIGKMTEFLKSEAKTETVVGQPFQLGSFTCVPVMAVGMGVGSGGGEGVAATKDEGTGVGGGAGLGMSPIGFLAVNGNDIQFISTRNGALSSILEKTPELLEKYLDSTKAKA